MLHESSPAEPSLITSSVLSPVGGKESWKYFVEHSHCHACLTKSYITVVACGALNATTHECGEVIELQELPFEGVAQVSRRHILLRHRLRLRDG